VDHKKKDYVAGPPGLLAEVADSSRSIDLPAKHNDYARYGVLEYLVVCLREARLRWFDLQTNQELFPPADGVFRIRAFPGLWINGEALLAKDYRRLMAILEQGLATSEHDTFVRRLAATFGSGEGRSLSRSKSRKSKKRKDSST
jgi:hypothetical protein